MASANTSIFTAGFNRPDFFGENLGHIVGFQQEQQSHSQYGLEAPAYAQNLSDWMKAVETAQQQESVDNSKGPMAFEIMEGTDNEFAGASLQHSLRKEPIKQEYATDGFEADMLHENTLSHIGMDSSRMISYNAMRGYAHVQTGEGTYGSSYGDPISNDLLQMPIIGNMAGSGTFNGTVQGVRGISHHQSINHIPQGIDSWSNTMFPTGTSNHASAITAPASLARLNLSRLPHQNTSYVRHGLTTPPKSNDSSIGSPSSLHVAAANRITSRALDQKHNSFHTPESNDRFDFVTPEQNFKAYLTPDHAVSKPKLAPRPVARVTTDPASYMTARTTLPTVNQSVRFRGFTTAQSQVTLRQQNDEMLVKGKQAGLTYKEIRKRWKGDKPAESTMRGRYRALTKDSKDRVRRPVWREIDVQLLKEEVEKHLIDLRITVNNWSSLNGEGKLHKVPWKLVAEQIKERGGSYHFGNSTCKRKYMEVARA